MTLEGAPPDPVQSTTRVLELTQARQSFTFTGVGAAPVPSLARDFSAPVIVEYPYSDDELAFLASHDSDPFNRWEAAQRLAVNAMLRVIAGVPAADACATFVQACARILADAALDPAFKDLALSLPAEGVVAEQLPIVDPVEVRRVRDGLARRLSLELAPAWQRAWTSHGDPPPYSAAPGPAGRRALKNTALAFWMRSEDPAAFAAAAEQFARADNMTDRHSALSALVNSSAPQREAALAAFATEFADEPLAMDKWFVLQATMHRQASDPPVLERVRKLLEHPAFSLKNPNKVRSLIGAFCNGNLAEFHAADGSGYAFWAEQVVRLDALNPQVAARIARALDRWRKFGPARQDAMRAALAQVAASPGLSSDVREIVEKARAS